MDTNIGTAVFTICYSCIRGSLKLAPNYSISIMYYYNCYTYNHTTLFNDALYICHEPLVVLTAATSSSYSLLPFPSHPLPYFFALRCHLLCFLSHTLLYCFSHRHFHFYFPNSSSQQPLPLSPTWAPSTFSVKSNNCSSRAATSIPSILAVCLLQSCLRLFSHWRALPLINQCVHLRGI